MTSVAAVIQARMSSSRLPGKVLMPIAGKPIIEHVLHKASQAKSITRVILATSDHKSDDPLAQWAQTAGYDVFRGSLDDVLSRFAGAAAATNCQAIVRITGDCPLIDPDIVDEMVATFISAHCDYASNACVRSYPRGLDVEIMSNKVLQEMHGLPTLTPYQREHVTPFIYQNRKNFNVIDVIAPPHLHYPEWRWCIDEDSDLQFVKEVFTALGDAKPEFRSADILQLLIEKPELLQINQAVQQKAAHA